MVGTDTLITKLTQKLGFFLKKIVPLLPRGLVVGAWDLLRQRWTMKPLAIFAKLLDKWNVVMLEGDSTSE